jgi:hypothetical protein
LVFIVWLIGKGGVILILPFFYLHLDYTNQKTNIMILPMYTEDEREELKKKFNKSIAQLGQIKDKESDTYKKLYEEVKNIYEIIHDL